MAKDSGLITPFKDFVCDVPKSDHSDWGDFGNPLPEQGDHSPTRDFTGKGGVQFVTDMHGEKAHDIAGTGSTTSSLGLGGKNFDKKFDPLAKK